MSGATDFHLYTTATSVVVPDLRDQAAGLAESTLYSWYVACVPQPGTANLNDELKLQKPAYTGVRNGHGRTFTTQ